jgi:hypothetical protein
MSLADVLIRSLKPESRACKRADAGGPYLEVRPTCAKLWRFKYRCLGKNRCCDADSLVRLRMQVA